MGYAYPPDFQNLWDEPAREIIREGLLLRPKLGREKAFRFMTTHGISPEMAFAYCCHEQRLRDRRQSQPGHLVLSDTGGSDQSGTHERRSQVHR